MVKKFAIEIPFHEYFWRGEEMHFVLRAARQQLMEKLLEEIHNDRYYTICLREEWPKPYPQEEWFDSLVYEQPVISGSPFTRTHIHERPFWPEDYKFRLYAEVYESGPPRVYPTFVDTPMTGDTSAKIRVRSFFRRYIDYLKRLW